MMCILSTDQQLFDVERFCASSGFHNSVLGIDPTFNLGDFYVTVTTYENLMLKNQRPCFHRPNACPPASNIQDIIKLLCSVHKRDNIKMNCSISSWQEYQIL